MAFRLTIAESQPCTGLCQQPSYLSSDESWAMHVINPFALCDTCTSRPCCDQEGVNPNSETCHLIRRAEIESDLS